MLVVASTGKPRPSPAMQYLIGLTAVVKSEIMKVAGWEVQLILRRTKHKQYRITPVAFITGDPAHVEGLSCG